MSQSKSEDKKIVFCDFQKKAVERLRNRKVRKHEILYIPSLDANIKIQSLIYPEMEECLEISEQRNSRAGDIYSVYLAVVEPNLQEMAVELKESGEIAEFTEIVEMFDASEIGEISMEVMKLSGFLGKEKIKVVEEVKNS